MGMRLTILKKGLILIAVPLVFQLAFFGLLADMQYSNSQAVAWSIHSKEVLQQTQVVLRNLTEMGTGLRGFILAADADLGKAYESAAAQLPRDIAELQNRVSDSPKQEAQAEAIASTTREYMAWHAETVRLSAAGQRDQAIARARSETNGRLQNAIVQAVKEFLDTEASLDKERTLALEQSRNRQQVFLWVGASAAFLITLGLAVVFSKSISGRLSRLADNVRRLAQGEELAPALKGYDEVAQLDRAFRSMAERIAESAQSLRRSADEVRELYDQARRSEQEIRRLNESLEERIAERTTELARANEALTAADRRKDEFLAMLAHELRNPLAPVRNALQIMKMPGVSADTVRQTREMMERQIQHLARLVDDLLDVSRIMRGKIDLHKEPVDLATVFARALETSQTQIDARGQKLSVSLPTQRLRMEADLIRLAQVIHNLLSNAARYTDKAGRICLTGERDGDDVVIRVRDSGMGIDPEILPHIFDPFVQGDRSLARSHGGLGIGLTLVRRLIELHGGSVSAASAGLGQGSEFTVRLPALAESLADDGGPAEEPVHPAGPPRRVLVVDDNVDAAESAAMLLRFLGHEVEIAHDGPSALEVAGEFRPEIVLLDIGLPGMNGYDVARALRAQPECKGVVIAAVTGYGQDSDRRRTQDAGFDYHLTKPLAPSVLTAFVASPQSPPAPHPET
jgi:two-component system CheB/CheR fusion protein